MVVEDDTEFPVGAEVRAVDEEVLLPPFRALAMIDMRITAPIMIPIFRPIWRFLLAFMICGSEPVFGLSDMSASISHGCDKTPGGMGINGAWKNCLSPGSIR